MPLYQTRATNPEDDLEKSGIGQAAGSLGGYLPADELIGFLKQLSERAAVELVFHYGKKLVVSWGGPRAYWFDLQEISSRGRTTFELYGARRLVRVGCPIHDAGPSESWNWYSLFDNRKETRAYVVTRVPIPIGSMRGIRFLLTATLALARNSSYHKVILRGKEITRVGRLAGRGYLDSIPVVELVGGQIETYTMRDQVKKSTMPLFKRIH